jgi:hypothetical protein
LKELDLIIGSPVDYNELVVYISHRGQDFCLINKEKGIEKMEIEFFKSKSEIKLDVNVFMKSVNKAVEILST